MTGPASRPNDTLRTLAIALLGGLLFLGLGLLVWTRELYEPVLGGLLSRAYAGAPPRPTIVFAVLDTVRADHLSLCGYERPTSPVLERLAESAAFTCDAYTPASWTLPSHASFFTGVDVPTHKADYAKGAQKPGEAAVGHSARNLSDALPTLAEQLAARGYQTVSVSANGLVSPATGLTRGFDVARWYTGIADGDWLLSDLRYTLRFEIQHDEPLFLFVNVADAHDPWEAVPEDVGWLPATPGIAYDRSSEDRAEPIHRFLRGEMEESERSEFLRRLRDVYDWGVHRADRTLGGVLESLEAHGWLDAGYRLVVTSDHGENLGDHALLDHGHSVYDSVTRVPLLYAERGAPGDAPRAARPDPPELEGPVWAVQAYHLARDGRLGENLGPVRATALPSHMWQRWYDPPLGRRTSAAIWTSGRKLVWEDGQERAYRLTEDPDERRPEPLLEPGPGRAALEALAAATLRLRAESADIDPETLKALQAVGYLPGEEAGTPEPPSE